MWRCVRKGVYFVFLALFGEVCDNLRNTLTRFGTFMFFLDSGEWGGVW